MKKYFFVVVVVVIALLALTACGGNNDPVGEGDTEEPAATETTASTPANEDEVDGLDVVGGFDVSTASDLRVTVLGTLNTNPRAAGNDILTPIWRERTRVIPDVVEYDQAAMGWAQFFQMHHLGGTMPQVIALPGGPFDNADAQMAMREFDILREITFDEILTYMPHTIARLEAVGIDPRQWYEANLDPVTGTLRYIPGMPNPALTTYRSEPEVMRNNSYEAYAWWFRDDILQMVFPNVRTEAELRDLFIEQDGHLTYDQVNDIPIHNLDDLANYLKAVRDLDLTVDGLPIVPGQIQLNDDIGSMMWSAFSLSGLYWHTLASRTYDFENDLWEYFAATENWKEYVRFFNIAYNERLIHPETFIMRDDQLSAMIANGQFAVWQMWHGDGATREAASERGDDFGIRLVHLFSVDSFSNNYQNAADRVIPMRETWNAVGITYALDEAHVPQILSWIDWNHSIEAADLRAWGLPEWSTGTGRDRRFLPEFRDLELWAVAGESGADRQDGIYYGMAKFDNMFETWNPETYGIGWTWAPFFTPHVAYGIDLSDPSLININNVVGAVRREHYFPMLNFWIEMPLGQEVIDARAEFDLHTSNVFEDARNDFGFDSAGGRAAIIAAIVGPIEDFDANYQVFIDNFINQQRWQDILAEEGRLYFEWMRLHRNYLIPLD